MPARTEVLFKWLFVIFFIVSGHFSQAQLKADFNASPASGCAPIVVKFADVSTGAPTTWKWDLGNGTISFLRNPSVTYFTPGQYSVKLIIGNAGGKDSITKKQYINVYATPAPEFSASATTGCFPLPVTFTDLSAAGSGIITKWEWDFGDGLNAADSSPQHTYKAAGSFNVSLRITNSLGCTKSITKPKYIQINTGVLVDFDIKMSNSCKAPANINFVNTSTGIGALNYQWDFGDGSGSSLTNPAHTYTNDGNYTVKLIAKNSTGCIDTLISLNAIILGNINADFSVSSKICQGSFADIKNINKPVAASVFWDFGDGSTSTDTTPKKKYASPGNYIIKMIANFGACLDSVSRQVTVLAKPVIAFTADKTNDCKVPLTVKFTQNTIGGVSYLWSFGDNTTSTDQNPAHTYNIPGNRDVKLIVTNAAGCSDTLLKPAFIKIQLPDVKILNLPATGCAPATFNFASFVTATGPVISYQWDFGDGSTSSIQYPSHTFLQPGRYTISVVITTAGGCTDTATFKEGVLVGTRPVALFSADPLDVCANAPVHFSDSSTGKIDKWNWLFGDGGTSNQQNPAHVYTDTGYFTVTLIVFNNGCADTLKLNDYVHIKPPIANFLLAFACTLPLQRVFTDKSIGADTWLWDFGDSTTSTMPSPVHTYNSPGTYTVKLTVTNATTGCFYTKQTAFSVIAEKANFKVSDSVICKGTSVNFQAINNKAANIASYSWNFGDGISLPSATGVIAHVYKLAGNYTVRLIIKDLLGCSDTIVKPLFIHVDGPTALFGVSTPGSCLNNAISFTDSSFSDGIHDIQQWVWNYGDGKSEILLAPPFQHSYTLAGMFTVKLKVIDSKGCKDSLIKPNALIISQPVANFKTKDTVSCPQKPVTFSNISTGPNLTYLWTFGDGATSSQLNPVHQYAAEGIYSISLSIADKYGCTGFLFKKDYIKIVLPVAGFSMSDSVSNCPPLVVNFTNASSNAIINSWDFGDGTTSAIKNPSHFYGFSGVYTVILKVTGAGGCIDQASKQITIKGPRGNFKYTNIIGCNPLQTNFKASTVNTDSIIWDFNDGNIFYTPDSVLTHKYINQGIYLPKIILVDASGCQVPIVGIDTIVVYGITADFNSSPVTICDSGAVKFNDNSISNDLITVYLWGFGDGTTSKVKDPVHNYQNGGLYNTKLLVTTRAGCMDSLTIPNQVKIINSPKIAIAGSVGACVPATLHFSANILIADTSAFSWSWNFGNGNTSTLQNPPDQVYPLSNSYLIKLTASNSTGCSTTVNKVVKAFPIPHVRIIADTNVCSGSTLNLLVQGAATYHWTPALYLSCTNCANPVAKPARSIQYSATGTSADGCVSSDSISIAVNLPVTVQVSRGDTLCAGVSTLLTASGGESYVWSPSAGLNNPLSANPVATPLKTTNYRVIASDNIGCFKDTGYVAILVYPIPSVNAGPDKTISVGKTIDLLPVISTDVTNVNWSPTSGIFRNNYPGIAVKPNESLEYTVEVSNNGGCLARDRVTVYVLCNDKNVFIPNTFSPNGDGTNDIFYPRGGGVFQVKVLKIFNRWGEVVFEKSNINANDITSGWDGTFKGQKLLPDIFVYVMDIICDNNAILTFKGNVALVR